MERILTKYTSNPFTETARELEDDHIKLLQEISGRSYSKEDYKSWVVNEEPVDQNIENNDSDKNTQFKSFQKAMIILLTTGQCLGLNPVTAILDKEIARMRFEVYSWRFMYTIMTATCQTIVTILCLHKVFNSSHISAHSIALTSFCLTCWSTTVLFIRIAIKWESLIKEIYNCNLDKYVNSNVIFRCNVACIACILLAATGCIIETLRDIAEVFDCTTHDANHYQKLFSNLFPLLENVNSAYFMPIGIVLQITLMMMNAISIYLDLFIICISVYLTSILNEINNKILWAADKIYLQPRIWGKLREDYSRATRLVRQFDDLFSGLVLVSFANNLFLICLHIFNTLSNGIRPKIINSGACPNYPSGLLYGYEYPAYVIFNLVVLIIKFLTVSLVAASVNDASLVPVTALYKVPSCSYSIEVQRFLDQVHDDVVALSGMEYFYITRGLVLSVQRFLDQVHDDVVTLSGMEYFYITRGLVLSVFGTILTYELVLLQFNSEELSSDSI